MHYGLIRKMDVANGEGIRISLFVSGCKFHCNDCFNTVAWDYEYGTEYTTDTHNQLIKLISNPNISGLSILGGDPLWQNNEGIEALIQLCKETHKLNKTVWLWSGFTWEQVFGLCQIQTEAKRQELILNCDVFIDGAYQADKKDFRLKWRGSSNQRVIDVQKSIKENKIVLYED